MDARLSKEEEEIEEKRPSRVTSKRKVEQDVQLNTRPTKKSKNISASAESRASYSQTTSQSSTNNYGRKVAPLVKRQPEKRAKIADIEEARNQGRQESAERIKELKEHIGVLKENIEAFEDNRDELNICIVAQSGTITALEKENAQLRDIVEALEISEYCYRQAINKLMEELINKQELVKKQQQQI